MTIERDTVPRQWPFLSPLADGPAEPPKCEKCGAEITTGLAAVLCPLDKDCALRGDAGESIDELRKDFGIDR